MINGYVMSTIVITTIATKDMQTTTSVVRSCFRNILQEGKTTPDTQQPKP